MECDYIIAVGTDKYLQNPSGNIPKLSKGSP